MPRTLHNLPTRAPRWLYAQARYLNASRLVLATLARRLLHIIQCLGAHYCTIPWQIFAPNRSDAYNFCSSSCHTMHDRTAKVAGTLETNN